MAKQSLPFSNIYSFIKKKKIQISFNLSKKITTRNYKYIYQCSTNIYPLCFNFVYLMFYNLKQYYNLVHFYEEKTL